MSRNVAGKRRSASARKAGGKGKKPSHNMTPVWCLVGLLFGGLLLALFQLQEEPDVPAPPRRTVIRPEIAAVSQEEVDVEQESDSVPATSPIPSAPAPTIPAMPDLEVIERPNEAMPEADESEDEQEPEEDTPRRDPLTATDASGEYYIDMKTRSLLFTEDPCLNDENLQFYLDAVRSQKRGEKYDEQAAERTDENKQVK